MTSAPVNESRPKHVTSVAGLNIEKLSDATLAMLVIACEQEIQRRRTQGFTPGMRVRLTVRAKQSFPRSWDAEIVDGLITLILFAGIVAAGLLL